VTVQRLRAAPGTVDALMAAISPLVSDRDAADPAQRSLFTDLKADPGKLGLETLLIEIGRLQRVRAVGLPAGLFAGVSEQRIAVWKARALAEFPSTLRRDHTPEVTLLAMLCWCRLTEITDDLVRLFIDLVNRINTRAEKRLDDTEDIATADDHRISA